MTNNKFKYDKTTDGWKLLKDVPMTKSFSIKKLELISFLKEDESKINGEEMVKRSKEMNCVFGQSEAEYLLENQKDIPLEWQKYYLIFPGTIWQDPNGYRRVPYLYWYGDRWYLDFHWLGPDWRDGYRLLRASPLNLKLSSSFVLSDLEKRVKRIEDWITFWETIETGWNKKQ